MVNATCPATSTVGESHVGHTSGGSRSLVLNNIGDSQPRHSQAGIKPKKIPESNVAVIAKLKTLGSSFSVNPWTLALATTMGVRTLMSQVPSKIPSAPPPNAHKRLQRVVADHPATACSHRRADGNSRCLEAPRASSKFPRWCMQSAVQAPPSQIA